MSEQVKKPTIWVGYYLVAFVDILNQKEALQSFKALPKTDSENQDFIKTMQKTFGVVDGFRDTFERFFRAENRPSEVAHLIREEHRQAFNEMRKTEVKFQRFADTFIIYVSLRTEQITVPINGGFSALAACASSFLISLAAEQVCRGGIEIGLAAEMNEGEIYGPALYEAYRLESEIAQYPRIVIGNGMMNYLTTMKDAQGTDVFATFTRRMANVCLGLIVQDVDGHPILDYLGEVFKERVGAGNLGDAPQKAYAFVCKEGERMRSMRNTKLAFRYDDLRQYIESRLHLWHEGQEQNAS